MLVQVITHQIEPQTGETFHFIWSRRTASDNVYAGHNGRGDRPTTGNVHVVPGGSRISSVCRPFRAQVVMLDYEIVEGTQGPAHRVALSIVKRSYLMMSYVATDVPTFNDSLCRPDSSLYVSDVVVVEIIMQISTCSLPADNNPIV